jgi:hypothetical protein
LLYRSFLISCSLIWQSCLLVISNSFWGSSLEFWGNKDVYKNIFSGRICAPQGVRKMIHLGVGRKYNFIYFPLTFTNSYFYVYDGMLGQWYIGTHNLWMNSTYWRSMLHFLIERHFQEYLEVTGIEVRRDGSWTQCRWFMDRLQENWAVLVRVSSKTVLLGAEIEFHIWTSW